MHDGFPLADLVSYNRKHNEANKQNNTDGTNDNDSWNCGVEGPTDDPAIRALRERQKRNFMATLLLSQGVPLIQAGDELGRTQHGNNNAYCQDNDMSWLDWDLDADRQAFLAFVRQVVGLRAAEPVFRRRTFFHGRPLHGVKDLYWLDATGREMTAEEWSTGWVDSLGMLLVGDEIAETDEYGRPVVGDSFLVLLNAAGNGVNFTFPPRLQGRPAELVFDTYDQVRTELGAAGGCPVRDHSTVVIRFPRS